MSKDSELKQAEEAKEKSKRKDENYVEVMEKLREEDKKNSLIK